MIKILFWGAGFNICAFFYGCRFAAKKGGRFCGFAARKKEIDMVFYSFLGLFYPLKYRFLKKLLTFLFSASIQLPALLSAVFYSFSFNPFPIGFSDDFRGFFLGGFGGTGTFFEAYYLCNILGA